MVDSIFKGLDIPNRETRFTKPPKETYAVWFDSVNVRGSDDMNLIEEHSLRIELYQYTPDSKSEQMIEKRLDDLALSYYKEERVWIESEQLYQVTYDLDYITKKGAHVNA